MQFVNPLFLFGLFAIAIPIIIHLFNFRKFQKVYFTNVEFIEELKQQTQKQSQLKHLIVMLLRILAIASLVLAFAQPYIPVAENDVKQDSQNQISIFVDNSFSMEAAAQEGILLDKAIQNARDIALAYKNSDLFQLLTNDFEGKHQRYLSREEFLEMLDEVRISSVSRNLSEVYNRQADLFGENKTDSHTAYLISDFQSSISDFVNIESDTAIRLFLIPVEATEKNNLFIDSIWFSSPVQRVDQLMKLNVRIKNASGTDFEKIPLKLMINDQQRAIASFDMRANDEVVVEMPYTNNEVGLMFGKLEITDFPITDDDSCYFTYTVSDQIPILSISKDEDDIYLHSLFGKDSAFIYYNLPVNQLDYSAFNNFNLIILNKLDNVSSGLSQELKRFAQNGGSVLIIPGAKIDFNNYMEFLLNLNSPYYTAVDTFQTKVSDINLQGQVFADVFESIPKNIDLPKVLKHYNLRRQTNSLFEPLLGLQNGNIFLGVSPVGKGKIYLLASPLNTEWGNFPKHAIFVPTLYKIALLSNPENKLFYTIGNNDNIVLRGIALNGDKVFKIVGRDNQFEVIPEFQNLNSQINIFTNNQIKKAGNFTINYDDMQISAVAFNYNRIESNLSNLDRQGLDKQIQDAGLFNVMVISPSERSLTASITELNKGFQLWKTFIILALLFLLGEVILLRFWKR
jgi:hypothetical protein